MADKDWADKMAGAIGCYVDGPEPETMDYPKVAVYLREHCIPRFRVELYRNMLRELGAEHGESARAAKMLGLILEADNG